MFYTVHHNVAVNACQMSIAYDLNWSEEDPLRKGSLYNMMHWYLAVRNLYTFLSNRFSVLFVCFATTVSIPKVSPTSHEALSLETSCHQTTPASKSPRILRTTFLSARAGQQKYDE